MITWNGCVVLDMKVFFLSDTDRAPKVDDTIGIHHDTISDRMLSKIMKLKQIDFIKSITNMLLQKIYYQNCCGRC